MTEDQVSISGIRVLAHHGVFEHERAEGQEFIVDAVLGLDLRGAAGSDDLSRTVDYGAVAQQIHDAVAADPVDLIETVAQRLVDLILATYPVSWVRVTVHKPQAPVPVAFTDVAVTIERSRE